MSPRPISARSRDAKTYPVILRAARTGTIVGGSFGFLDVLLALASPHHYVFPYEVVGGVAIYLVAGLVGAVILSIVVRVMRGRPPDGKSLAAGLIAIVFFGSGALNLFFLSLEGVRFLSWVSLLAYSGWAILSGLVFLLAKRSLEGVPEGTPRLARAAALTLVVPLPLLGDFHLNVQTFFASPGLRALGVDLLLMIPLLVCSWRWRRRPAPGRKRMKEGTLLAGGAALAVMALAGGLAWNTQDRFVELGEKRGPKVENGPNVILIILDTLRADHVEGYGALPGSTPHLAALAAESVLYTDAMAPSPWTLPSHASLFTGLYPAEHGAIHDPSLPKPYTRGLALGYTTLAEILHARGYDTAMVTANSYLTPPFGVTQGFQFFLPPRGNGLRRHAWHRVVQAISRDLGDSLGGPHYPRAEIVNRGVYRFLRSAEAPFFLFINYVDPHSPYRPPRGFRPRGLPLRPELEGGYNRFTRQVLAGKRSLRRDERNHILALYRGEILYLDRELGRLMKQLAGLGVSENTLLVVTSDHGELFGEHGLLQHGRVLYNELLQVPLLIRYPGGHTRSVVERPVSLIGVPGEILAILGIPSSLPRLGEAASLFAEYHPTQEDQGRFGGRFDRHVWAIKQGGYKLMESSTGEIDLFDLGLDRSEAEDLSRSLTRLASSLRQDLESWRLQAHGRRLSADEPPELDPEVERKLKALGYL